MDQSALVSGHRQIILVPGNPFPPMRAGKCCGLSATTCEWACRHEVRSASPTAGCAARAAAHDGHTLSRDLHGLWKFGLQFQKEVRPRKSAARKGQKMKPPSR
jgi:hypothetical protein